MMLQECNDHSFRDLSQTFGHHPFGVELGPRTNKHRCCVKCHYFERAVPISKPFQSIGVSKEKLLLPEDAPLNDVSKFMEMDRLVS